MSRYFTIKITGGTSPGPYTIYFNEILVIGNIPPIYESDPIIYASGLTRDDLTEGDGITVEVPDNIESLFLYNEYCLSEILLTASVKTTYKDFCLTYAPLSNPSAKKPAHFIPSDELDSNGNPFWEFQNSKALWNPTESQWDIIGYSPDNLVFFDDVSPINSNPPLNWQAIGGGQVTVESVEGSCFVGRSTNFPVSINQPTCFCDGSIIFNVSLDNPPYSYSIDNGVTYSSSPIFTKLCSGIYLLSVSDYLGNVFSKTITIDKPEIATTYTLSLNTTTTTPIINETSLVNSYETTITVTPPLPDGTTITFDLIHDNNFYSSPTSGTSVLTTGTILNSNFTTIPISFTSTGNTKSVNTRPGCQSDFIYQSDINEVWNSITLTNTDTIVISTTTRVDKTTTGLCVVGYSNDTYSIANAIISGCDCCSLIVNT